MAALVAHISNATPMTLVVCGVKYNSSQTFPVIIFIIFNIYFPMYIYIYIVEIYYI